jgi:hypothetical protein
LLSVAAAAFTVLTMGYVPGALPDVASLAKLAVTVSPFLTPVTFPVKTAGFGWVWVRVTSSATTARGAGATERVPVFTVT